MTSRIASRRPALLAVAALAVALATPARAQQPLTLSDAVAIAQRQGFQARAAVGSRDAARARDRQFFAGYLPGLTLNGTAPTYTRSITQVPQPDGSVKYLPVEQTQGSLTASITQRVPWTNTTLAFNSGLSQVQVIGQTSFRTWNATPYSVSLIQPIFRANTQHWDVKQQALRYTSAERRYLEAREDVALLATNAFFDLHGAQVTLRNATANAATNDTLYTLNKGRLEVGKIGENDLLQSELALLRSRAAAEDAQLAHERALSLLRIALSLASDAPVSIAAGQPVPGFDADTAIAAAQARRNASAMSDTELAEVAADRNVSEARWNTGPNGNLIASYGFNATAPLAPDAYKNLLEARQMSFGVSIPVWLWGAHSSAVQAAKSDRLSAKATAGQSRATVEHNARFAALQLSQARRTLFISAKADTVAQKRFEVALGRYVIGRITLDNLFLAQNEKDQAAAAYVQAQRNYWAAYYGLRKTTLYDFEAAQPLAR